MTRTSPPDLMVLHATRLLGMASEENIARRAGVPLHEAFTRLMEGARRDWVQEVAFADLRGWTLTDCGRQENERLLAREREQADPGGRIAAVHQEFLPLNARLLRASTDWQMRPTPEDAFAPNDHTDPTWDERILAELGQIRDALPRLTSDLTAVLARFARYDTRFAFALHMAQSGQHHWVDKTGIDSCHRVWFELHEDLIATLGIDRADEQSRGSP